MTNRFAMALGLAALSLAGLGTAGCASADARLASLPADRSPAYLLGSGDELRVSVAGLDTMNNTYRVDDTGSIAVPMLGPIKVADLSVREVEAAIAGGIRERQLVLDPQVSAQVVAYRPFYIMGEVQRPGQYPYVPGMSLMTAVSVAGGYTFRANTKTAIVTRRGGPGANGTGKVGPDAPIMPGDQIVIRESWF